MVTSIAASLLGYSECVRLLLAKPEIFVNAKDLGGNTALIQACDKGKPDVVRLLLGHPAIDTSITTLDGETAAGIASDDVHWPVSKDECAALLISSVLQNVVNELLNTGQYRAKLACTTSDKDFGVMTDRKSM